MKKTCAITLLIFLFLTQSRAQDDSSRFEGKNLVTFGNSITSAQNSWAYQLFRELKFANLYNGAVGGAIWSKRNRTTQTGLKISTQNYDDADFAGISNKGFSNPDDLEFQKRINNCAIVHIQKYLSDKNVPAPDFIILSYGTNDLSSDVMLGDAEVSLKERKLEKLELTNLAGSLKWCLSTLKERFPKAKLYVALPLQATKENKNKENLRKIAVITKICDGLSVPYFNCFEESGITQQNSAQYLRDGLHPNEEGKTVHANYMIRKLKQAN